MNDTRGIKKKKTRVKASRKTKKEKLLKTLTFGTKQENTIILRTKQFIKTFKNAVVQTDTYLLCYIVSCRKQESKLQMGIIGLYSRLRLVTVIYRLSN